MPNTLITPSVIAKEALFQLENNCILGDKVHRDYKQEFRKVGDTVSIRRPVKFVTSDGATRQNQDVNESSVPITLNQRKHVSWEFSSQELTLDIEEYSERYIKPAMITLANTIDRFVATIGARGFPNIVGTPGTTPSDFQALSDVAQRMDELAVPEDGRRCLVLDSNARWALANGLGGAGSGGLFNANMVQEMTRRGFLGRLATMEIFGDQNIERHQWGVGGGTPLLAGAMTNEDATIAIDGVANTAAWARAGDVITIAGVNDVNPISKQDTGRLKEFVVTADATSAGGVVTLSISPTPNDGSTASTAAEQNCTALGLDNAAVLFAAGIGTTPASAVYPQNLAFHRNALALVTAPLELPHSAEFKARADWRGYSIRVVKDYDINNDVDIIRLDVLYGCAAIYPELGVRLTG